MAFALWLAVAGGSASGAQPVGLATIDAAIRAHLTSRNRPDAEPLRWAITAVDPNRGLRLEGVAIHETRGQRGAA